MFDLIKRDNGIWEWHNVCESSQDIIDGALAKQWFDYTNDEGGGGSTVKGRGVNIWPEEYPYEQVLSVFNRCLKEYSDLNGLPYTESNIDTGRWLFREYLEGTFMNPHEDNYSYAKKDGENVRPKLTILFYLNDDYVGGEIFFPNELDNLRIKPVAGSVVIFPSNKPHGVDKMISGKRYMTQTYVHDQDYSTYDASDIK